MHPQILIPVGFAIFLGGGVAGFLLKSRLVAAADALKNSAVHAEKQTAERLAKLREKI